MNERFGRFTVFEDFLTSYRLSRRDKDALHMRSLPLERAIAYAKGQRDRDVVEFRAIITEYRGLDHYGEGVHQHMVVRLTETIEVDADVRADVERALAEGSEVFVAVRFGDFKGLAEPVKGLEAGMRLHLRGEWVRREEAYSHGGEPTPVVHFVHYPIGFICTPVACYR